MDVVVNTDILSTLAKINKLKLLSKLFRKSSMLICPSVSREIKKGVELGLLSYSQPSDFQKIMPSIAEKNLCKELREQKNLGFADAECVAIARNRSCLLITNDREARKVADSLSIYCLNLPSLLRELWKSHTLPKPVVAELVKEIERKDRIVIKNKALIFT
jgi:predicted nucleic acid-binding protein